MPTNTQLIPQDGKTCSGVQVRRQVKQKHVAHNWKSFQMRVAKGLNNLGTTWRLNGEQVGVQFTVISVPS